MAGAPGNDEQDGQRRISRQSAQGNARTGSSTEKSTVTQASNFPAGDTILR
jgi:hypothetical protein